jgi:hypothetical protein
MPSKVYIETTIVSYLTGRPSGEPLALAHQQVTKDWWATKRLQYELYVSEVVVAEAERGDRSASAARLQALSGLPRLAATPDSERLAPVLLRETRLPADAFLDMSHVAIAAVHGMDYLLTWNCRHIANATVIRIVERICRTHGYEPPVICTPEELMGS